MNAALKGIAVYSVMSCWYLGLFVISWGSEHLITKGGKMEDLGLECLGTKGRFEVKGQESGHSQCRSCAVVLLSVALHCGQWCLDVHNRGKGVCQRRQDWQGWPRVGHGVDSEPMGLMSTWGREEGGPALADWPVTQFCRPVDLEPSDSLWQQTHRLFLHRSFPPVICWTRPCSARV